MVYNIREQMENSNASHDRSPSYGFRIKAAYCA